jgi:hypothetical protein
MLILNREPPSGYMDLSTEMGMDSHSASSVQRKHLGGNQISSRLANSCGRGRNFLNCPFGIRIRCVEIVDPTFEVQFFISGRFALNPRPVYSAGYRHPITDAAKINPRPIQSKTVEFEYCIKFWRAVMRRPNNLFFGLGFSYSQ